MVEEKIGKLCIFIEDLIYILKLKTKKAIDTIIKEKNYTDFISLTIFR